MAASPGAGAGSELACVLCDCLWELGATTWELDGFDLLAQRGCNVSMPVKSDIA